MRLTTLYIEFSYMKTGPHWKYRKHEFLAHVDGFLDIVINVNVILWFIKTNQLRNSIRRELKNLRKLPFWIFQRILRWFGQPWTLHCWYTFIQNYYWYYFHWTMIVIFDNINCRQFTNWTYISASNWFMLSSMHWKMFTLNAGSEKRKVLYSDPISSPSIALIPSLMAVIWHTIFAMAFSPISYLFSVVSNVSNPAVWILCKLNDHNNSG